jgi:tRNA dimethylallyltransferase
LEPKVIVIVGPTCSGKTTLAIDLALKLKTEIISADSRQVYKYLNIGTAKPNLHQREEVIHHFVDLLNPDGEINASKFSIEASKVIDELHRLGKIPIIVGGSGLYIKALVDGIIDDIETDEDYRSELYELRKRYGDEFLYLKLKKVDSDSAGKMLPQNWKRVIRALEVHHITGKPIGYFHSNQKQKVDYNFRQYGLEWERKKLYDNINVRVDDMIATGLVDEVKSILAMGFDKKINALNTVGYKEIISYLEEKISLDNAIELIKRNTRHFAKRQITWFKADNRIEWLTVDSINDLIQHSELILRNYQEIENYER